MMHKLPSFKSMWSQYPKEEINTLKQKIGGKVNQPGIQNTCTVRLSHAFNYSGDPILYTSSAKKKPLSCVSGADGKWYAYRVAEMTDYLTRRYGEAQIKVKGTRRQQLEAVKGHKGIILFKFPPDPKRPFTGHFDIWNGRAARSGAYFNDEVEVWLWELA